MRTKNQTPFPFGFKVGARRPPQRELTFIVRGTFVLAAGKLEPLRTPRALPEFAEVDAAAEGLDRLAQGSLEADRFADTDEERAGELLYPSDFADWKKNAEVMVRGHAHAHGRAERELTTRVALGSWQKTLRVRQGAEPAPIDWAHTAGGPDLLANPVGTSSPSVVYPSGRTDLPASYAPMNVAWSIRAEKIGKKYDGDYARKRAPFFAEDFDYGYFHAAPPDQQLDGYLRGDEVLRLEHLTVSARVLEAALPGLRLRVFVRTTAGETKAVQMLLDTVFCDADAELVYLTWRGLTPVAEDDLSDLAFALVASEDLSEPPRPDAAYVQELDAFAKDPIGLVRPEEAGPLGEVAAEQAAAAKSSGKSPVDLTKPETLTALLSKLMGPAAAAHSAAIEQAVAKAVASPAMQQRAAKPAPKVTGLGGGLAMKAAAKPTVALGGPLAQAMAHARAAGKSGGAEEQAALDRFDAAMKRSAADAGCSVEQGTDEPGPGAKLAGRDLSGVDLAGRDLSGADLEGANLTDANLAGSDLSGARLANAVLTGATLADADLSGADLTCADLTRAKAAGVKLKKSNLDMVVFRETDLAGADLSGSKGMMTSFSDVSLAGAKMHRVSFEQASFDGCNLGGASLAGAKLVRSLFRKLAARGLCLQAAEITRTTFLESDLAGARVAGAHGVMAIFQRSDVTGADFSGVAFVDGVLRELVAERAVFRGASLRAASLYRSVLKESDFTGADLMGADLRKTSLTNTRFVEASLYDAKLIEAAGTGVCLLGANLARANFDRAQVVRV